MPRTYVVKTIEDAMKIPEGSIDNFLVDLGIHLKMHKKIAGCLSDLALSGVGVDLSHGMLWIDDGKHDYSPVIINDPERPLPSMGSLCNGSE